MKATVINPAKKKGSKPKSKKAKSSADHMAYVRSFKKSKKKLFSSPARKATRKRITAKRNPVTSSSPYMRQAHSNISGLVNEIVKKGNITIDLSITDLSWLNYILSRI